MWPPCKDEQQEPGDLLLGLHLHENLGMSVCAVWTVQSVIDVLVWRERNDFSVTISFSQERAHMFPTCKSWSDGSGGLEYLVGKGSKAVLDASRKCAVIDEQCLPWVSNMREEPLVWHSCSTPLRMMFQVHFIILIVCHGTRPLGWLVSSSQNLFFLIYRGFYASFKNIFVFIRFLCSN